jgi:hypothetical protein
MKFGTGIFLQTSSRKREFCEHRSSDRHTSLEAVTELLAVFSLHASSPLWVEFGADNIQLMSSSNFECHKKAVQ